MCNGPISLIHWDNVYSIMGLTDVDRQYNLNANTICHMLSVLYMTKYICMQLFANLYDHVDKLQIYVIEIC